MDEQRKWFLETESTPSKDAMKIIEMTAKDLEYYVNLVDKTPAGFEKMTPILKEVLTWVKCYQTALPATDKSFVKGGVNCAKLHCRFKKSPQPAQPSATATLLSQQPSTSRQDPPPAKRLKLKVQVMVSIFYQ